MIDPIMIWNVGQLVFLGLMLRWLHVQTRDNKQGLESMAKTTYDKADTEKLIDLKLKPMEVQLTNIQKDLAELKSMLARLLDAKI